MPSPTVKPVETMDFPTALRHVIKGQKITKLEWENTQFYGVLRDTLLMLHKPDGQFYTWTINEGDLLGADWIVLDHDVLSVTVSSSDSAAASSH